MSAVNIARGEVLFNAALLALRRTANNPKEIETATRLFKEAAFDTHPGAEYFLAHSYKEGWTEEPDTVLYLNWLRISANHGCPEAQFELAKVYQEGKYDNIDTQKSWFWYEKAVSQNPDLRSGDFEPLLDQDDEGDYPETDDLRDINPNGKTKEIHKEETSTTVETKTTQDVKSESCKTSLVKVFVGGVAVYILWRLLLNPNKSSDPSDSSEEQSGPASPSDEPSPSYRMVNRGIIPIEGGYLDPVMDRVSSLFTSVLSYFF